MSECFIKLTEPSGDTVLVNMAQVTFAKSTGYDGIRTHLLGSKDEVLQLVRESVEDIYQMIQAQRKGVRPNPWKMRPNT